MGELVGGIVRVRQRKVMTVKRIQAQAYATASGVKPLLLDGDLELGGCLAVLVGGVEGIGGRGGGSDLHGGAACGANLGSDDDVVGVGDLPR